MMSIALTLNRKGYDSFIDYVKGLAILFVILTHLISADIHKYTLFCLWGDMAVPLFLLIQVFHAYKKDQVVLKWTQVFRRIIVPFVITQVVICVLLIVMNRRIDISSLDGYGNLGPGAYYPYIYIEFAILLLLIAPWINKVKSTVSLLFIFIIVSQLLELISIYLRIPFDVYRFLFFRYTFLIYLGYLIAKGKLVLNKLLFVISLISLFLILMFDGIIGGAKNFHVCFIWMDGEYFIGFAIIMLLLSCFSYSNGFLIKWIRMVLSIDI